MSAIITLVFVGFLLYVMYSNIKALFLYFKVSKEVKQWPTTRGTMLATAATAPSYEYRVGETTFTGTTINLWRPPNPKTVAKKYPAGAAVQVYYNPANPQAAVLER